MVIIITINEVHEELHCLIKEKNMHKTEEKEKKIVPISQKSQPVVPSDPRKIIKGKFDCFLDKPLPGLKSE